MERTLFTRVLRLPTKIVLPSTKYVYAVWSAVSKKYLEVKRQSEQNINHSRRAYKKTPIATKVLEASNSVFQPYRPVAIPTTTEATPRPIRVSE